MSTRYKALNALPHVDHAPVPNLQPRDADKEIQVLRSYII